MDDRRVVERPGHGVARTHGGAQDWRLAGLGLRGLAVAHHEAAARVLGRHRAFENGDQRPLRLDIDVELGAAYACHGEGRVDVEAVRPAREEMHRAAHEVDDAFALLLRRFDGDGGVRVETQHRLIEQGHVGAAALMHPDLISGAESVVQLDGLPIAGTDALRVDATLYRDCLRRRRIAGLGRRRLCESRARRKHQRCEQDVFLQIPPLEGRGMLVPHASGVNHPLVLVLRPAIFA